MKHSTPTPPTVQSALAGFLTWFEGRWHAGNVPILGAADHGAWLGTMVFDGARAFEGVTPDLDLHCARLGRSAEAMGLAAPLDARAIEALIRDGIRRLGPDRPLYLRPMLWSREGSPAIIDALPASTALQMAVASALVRRKYHPGRARQERFLSSPLWREALPFFSSTLVRYVTIRSDVVLLGFLRGAAAAGIYNVAYRVVFLLMYVPYYASLAALPIISRLHHRRSSEAHELIQASVGWMILIGVPASVGLSLIAQPLTVIAMVLVVRAWREKYWTRGARLLHTGGVVAALALVWFLEYWNLLGYRIG